MRALIYFCLALLFVAPAAIAGTEAADDHETANRLLRAEYDLARTKQLYFYCDLPGRRLQFKTAGVSLAELPIAGIRRWGRLPASSLRTVATKVAPFSPQREKVGIVVEKEEKEKPAEGADKEKKTFEIKALEITDMPTRFHIVLDDGLRIVVDPAEEEGTAAWLAKGRLFLWYLSQPMISNWNFLHDKPYTELHLTLAPRDVQLLYWSLAEGSSLLLATPAED